MTASAVRVSKRNAADSLLSCHEAWSNTTVFGETLRDNVIVKSRSCTVHSRVASIDSPVVISHLGGLDELAPEKSCG